MFSVRYFGFINVFWALIFVYFMAGPTHEIKTNAIITSTVHVRHRNQAHDLQFQTKFRAHSLFYNICLYQQSDPLINTQVPMIKSFTPPFIKYKHHSARTITLKRLVL